MQDTWTWSMLLFVFGLSAPLVTASLLQTADVNSPTPSTMVTMMSANLTATKSLTQRDMVPTPAASPTLSIISDYIVPTPNPGSIAIINGITQEVPKYTTPILPDLPEGDTALYQPWNLSEGDPSLTQPWNLSYPGPIHDGDFQKYLTVWDPVWWSKKLDSLRQTSCHCSADDFYTNENAQLASYMSFEYYSHQDGHLYTFSWICGPVKSSMSIRLRFTSDKRRAEHCWSLAGGDEDSRKNPKVSAMRDWYCDPDETLCVRPWRTEQRQLKFHGHVRNYDRHGVHTWAEIQPVVSDVCLPKCRDLFLMNFDDYSHHNPSFITTFYPPKPIDLTLIGD